MSASRPADIEAMNAERAGQGLPPVKEARPKRMSRKAEVETKAAPADEPVPPTVTETRKLSVKYRAPTELTGSPRNARTHDPSQVDQLRKSILEFGFTNPVLIDEKDEIIAGHGRVMAALELGLTEVPTIRLDGLTKAQQRAYRLADNRLPLNAGWDVDLLSLELDELQDLGIDGKLLGFTAAELDEYLGDAPAFGAGTLDEQGKLDKLSPILVVCPHCSGEFNARFHFRPAGNDKTSDAPS